MHFRHLKRIEEDAIGTLMGGQAQSTRRFRGDMCRGVLIKKRMYEFWGDALEHLLFVANKIHIEKNVCYNEHLKKPMKTEDVNYELGIVIYPGTGKYKNNEDCRYVPFQ